MTYRDEQQAALSRAEALQREVEAARQELGQLRGEQKEAARLRKKLAATERKLAVLQGHRPPRLKLLLLVAFAVFAGAGAIGFFLARSPKPPIVVVAASPADRKEPRTPELDLAHGSAAMLRAGVSQPTLEVLAQLNQLGWHKDVVAMRQAGVSDSTVLQLARMRSRQQLSVSGQDISRLRHAGMADETIVKLATRGLRSDQIAELVAQRQAGLSDSKILSQFKPSTPDAR